MSALDTAVAVIDAAEAPAAAPRGNFGEYLQRESERDAFIATETANAFASAERDPEQVAGALAFITHSADALAALVNGDAATFHRLTLAAVRERLAHDLELGIEEIAFARFPEIE